MRAIEYTNKASRNVLHLFYSTCTNDLIINSKQATIIENFLLAFCIEFNRLFIADSLFMNVLQKHLIVKMKVYLDAKKSLYKIVLTDNKNAISSFFNGNNKFSMFNKTINDLKHLYL